MSNCDTCVVRNRAICSGLDVDELAALNAPSGEAYNICSGQSFRIQDALDRMLALGQCAIEVQPDPARMRPADVPEMRGSHEKFTAATGWRPEIDFDVLLTELLTYWRGTLRGAPATRQDVP